MASANGGGVREGARTVALQDGADTDGDGLTLGGNLNQAYTVKLPQELPHSHYTSTWSFSIMLLTIS